MSGENNDVQRVSSRPYWIGLTLSVAYVLLAVVLFREKLVKVPELEANNIGDVLAGIFAPLAFIWLVVTSLAQKAQLRLQSIELSLLRKEHQDSRVVAKQQQLDLKEAAQQNERQADALLETLRIQIDKQNIEAFEMTLYQFAVLLHEIQNHQMIEKYKESQIISKAYPLIPRFFEKELMIQDIDRFYLRLASQIDQFRNNFLSIFDVKDTKIVKFEDVDRFVSVYKILSNRIIELYREEIELMKSRYILFNFNSVLPSLSVMIARLENLPIHRWS